MHCFIGTHAEGTYAMKWPHRGGVWGMLPQENFEIYDALWCNLGHSGSSFDGSITAI